MEHGVSGLLGRRKTFVQRRSQPFYLTPTGLLMEGDFTSMRFSFAFFIDDECYGDIQQPVRCALMCTTDWRMAVNKMEESSRL